MARRKTKKAEPQVRLPDLMGDVGDLQKRLDELLKRFKPSPITPQGTRNTRHFQFFDKGTRARAVPRSTLSANQTRGPAHGGPSRASVL